MFKFTQGMVQCANSYRARALYPVSLTACSYLDVSAQTYTKTLLHSEAAVTWLAENNCLPLLTSTLETEP